MKETEVRRPWGWGEEGAILRDKIQKGEGFTLGQINCTVLRTV